MLIKSPMLLVQQLKFDIATVRQSDIPTTFFLVRQLELYQKCPTDNGSDEYEIERGFDEGSVGGNYITE